MAKQNRFKQLVNAFGGGGMLTVPAIHTVEVFKAFLAHERAVSERHGQVMCVLAFSLKDELTRPTMARLLGKICASSLRITDVVGWLDDATVGIMLPCTYYVQANLLARRICEKLLANGTPLDFTLYAYPEEDNAPPPTKSDLPAISPPPTKSDLTALSPPPTNSELTAQLPPPTKSGLTALPENVRSIDDLCVPSQPVWKRATDILLSLLAIAGCAPLLVCIAILIKLVSPGPLLFCQERVGYRGRRFKLYKFRSMHVVADTQVHQQHLAELMKTNASLTKLDKHDNRLIPLGKIFRASGLDELPQLFNILRGDMSLIGPRPCVPYEYENFQAWHKRRFHVRPGLTGLWQVSGKNRTTFQEMMRFDNAYTRKPSFFSDLRIILKTLPVICGQIWESSRKRRET